MIGTYYARISREYHDELIQRFLRDFSKEFQYKILNYRRWQDAQLSLLGRLLLKQGLKDLHNIPTNKNLDIQYSDYNKPYLVNEFLKFSISHSGNIAVCTITNFNDIGIDIEKMKSVEVSLFKNQMTIFEWKLINNSIDKKNAFYNYWTQKEAVIKANGKGLSIPLTSFEIIDSQVLLNNELYTLKELKIAQDYKCHLAIKGCLNNMVKSPEVRGIDVSFLLFN
ncbi:4'-phosphopantetheinyl transferase family protein [Sinomicrobium oceani]|uniref:4'-phosphopantetheinyl transferase family protein n=1 Tax=Sinomicrobium oceani TaxID=1150368 RepID=UPI00227D305B|nr:4'-phosphopantetheinyl transferase superfamily protein [Sinomicrobium oceani]